MTHNLTNHEKFLRELKDTKRYYSLRRDEATSRYVGKCIKVVKWLRRNGINGKRAGELLSRMCPDNFMMYVCKNRKKSWNYKSYGH